jgi:hypothetical protein
MHDLKAEPVVDHGEAARGQRDALPIGAGNVFAFGRREMREPDLGRELRDSVIEFPSAQGIQKITGEYDALYTVGVEPPSMRKVVPVMKSVSGLARKQTAAAISIGCPSLLTVWCTMFLRAYSLPNSGSSLPCLCAVSMNHLSSCGV